MNTPILTPISPDVWGAEHDHFLMGLHFRGRMVVVRLPGGGLWVHSPIRIDDALGGAIDRLGRVEHIVAPSLMHHVYAGEAASRWPGATLWLAPGLAEKRPDLGSRGRLLESAAAESAWGGAIAAELVGGLPSMNEVIFVLRASRQLVVTDLVMNIHSARGLLSRAIFWLEGVWKRPWGPRVYRLAVKDRGAFARSLDRVISEGIDGVIPAHGEVVASGASAILVGSFGWSGLGGRGALKGPVGR